MNNHSVIPVLNGTETSVAWMNRLIFEPLLYKLSLMANKGHVTIRQYCTKGNIVLSI